MTSADLKFMGEAVLEMTSGSGTTTFVTLPNDQLFSDLDNLVFASMYSDNVYSDETLQSQTSKDHAAIKLLSGQITVDVRKTTSILANMD
jgi:hypothetical protein